MIWLFVFYQTGLSSGIYMYSCTWMCFLFYVVLLSSRYIGAPVDFEELNLRYICIIDTTGTVWVYHHICSVQSKQKFIWYNTQLLFCWPLIWLALYWAQFILVIRKLTWSQTTVHGKYSLSFTGYSLWSYNWIQCHYNYLPPPLTSRSLACNQYLFMYLQLNR